MSTSDPELAFQIRDFALLFRGYPHAHGVGTGGWVHKPADIHTFATHVMGKGPGLGIGPLLPDGTCWFGAIDLDEPNFELAGELASLLPGVSWIERSRSGNAHVLVFFYEPAEAWIVRGIMREALAAVGRKNVEVFPKSDMLHPGMVGNYLNLPYFGDTRQIVAWKDDEGLKTGFQNFPESGREFLSFARFVNMAFVNRNDPADWRKRAKWLGVPSPEERKASQERQFGESPELHRCAAYIIEHREDNPVREGSRAAVYFMLAKCLSNWSEIDHDEALGMLNLVNDASPDPVPPAELARILENTERGGYTSTGCDDALVLEYRDPTCTIGV